MKHLSILIALALATAAVAGEAEVPSDLKASQEPLLQRLWAGSKVTDRRTPHYYVRSDCGKNTTDFAAKTMELLYLNLKRTFSFEGEADKVRVLVFEDRLEFAEYLNAVGATVPENCVGLYAPMAKEIIALDYGKNDDLTRVLLHEGTHQLVHLVTTTWPPIWANEGIAVYFESSEWKGNALRTGVVPKDRLRHLKQALRRDEYRSLKNLIDMSYGEEFELLEYGEAWSLVYFFAKADGGRYAKRFRDYFKMLKDGVSAENAFHEAFEKDFGAGGFDALEARWKKFVLKEIR